MAALLIGKTAAITGAVTGIGRAITAEYLRHGASVVVNHLDDDASREHFEMLRKQAPDPKKLYAVAGNIANRNIGQSIVRSAIENFGGLDVFVANAGVSQFKDFLTSVHCFTSSSRLTII